MVSFFYRDYGILVVMDKWVRIGIMKFFLNIFIFVFILYFDVLVFWYFGGSFREFYMINLGYLIYFVI